MRSLFLMFGLLFISLYSKQSLAASFQLGERVSIESNVLSQTRELQILLPENYHANKATTYPVIYLLDGDYNMHGISGMLDLLANKGQLIPDVILVGIADKGTTQYRQFMTPADLTPMNDKSSEKVDIKQGAAEFLTFITDEVKPYIQKHYRTADNTTLLGQSMGGLFVLNALLEKPDEFNHYIAISPSVWVAEQGIVKKAKAKFSSSQHQPVNLFLSLADETRMGQYDFINLLDLGQPKNIQWSFKHYADENHNSIGLIAFRDNLKNIYKQWYISEKLLTKFNEPEDIVSYYHALLGEYKVNQVIPSASIKAMVRHHYRHNKLAELPAFIEAATKKLPASKQAFIAMQASYVSHFDSPEKALNLLLGIEKENVGSIDHLKAIASTYEKVGEQASALTYYKKALAVAKKQKANQWQLNILEDKIAQ